VAPDTRSSQEKANSLVQQFLEERELDSKQPDVADEIAQRLARLRDQDMSSLQTPDTSSHQTPTGEEKVSCKNVFV
jgi:hypothetical protein